MSKTKRKKRKEKEKSRKEREKCSGDIVDSYFYSKFGVDWLVGLREKTFHRCRRRRQELLQSLILISLIHQLWRSWTYYACVIATKAQ